MDAFGKLGAWARTHRTQVLAGGGAGVAGLAYVVRRRSRAGAGTGYSSPAGDAAAAAYGQPAGVVDSGPLGGISASDAFAVMLANQSAFQSAVQGEIANLPKPAAAAAQPHTRPRVSWHPPSRPRVPAAPRPVPVQPYPNVAAILRHRREAGPAPRLTPAQRVTLRRLVAQPGPIVRRP